MKKFLVALMVICVALSCFSFAVLAEEAPAGDAQGAAKTVESLVGAYYLQGECGYGAVPGGGTYQTEYDWTIADQLAKALNGTNRIPFYAGQNEDGSLFFDRMAQQAFKYEIEYAIASGIDFIAYRYYPGFGTSGGKKRNLQFMNNQLKMHSTLAGQAVGFSKEVDFALVLDEDFNAAKDADLIIDEYIVVKGYLTAADGRPVVFILWNDNIATQISSTNKKLKKVIADGHNPKKNAPETLFDESIESMYVVALNAPSYEEAIAAGADAVSWFEGSGSNGEAYSAMTQKVEANWASAESNVVPNVVTGFDKRVLAANPIEVTMKKYASDKTTSVRYSRTGAESDYVAAATPDELVAHIKKAVETTNKPKDFSAVMVYAWDDFAGGAYLCPTKTDTAYEYEFSYLKAMRQYFYGTADGFPVMADPYGPEATATPDQPHNGGDSGNNAAGFSLFGLDTVASVAIIVGAVVVIAVVVIVIVASSKKKAPAKKEETKKEEDQ